MKSKKAQIISSEQFKTIEWAPPASWGKAVGILRTKKKSVLRHIEKIRNEW